MTKRKSRIIAEINIREASNAKAKWWPNQASTQPKWPN